MKNIILSAAILSCITTSNAQQQDIDRTYGGLKIGANQATNIYSPDIPQFSTSYQTGFAGGIYYNLGIGKAFSIQPELLYSDMGTKAEYTPNNGFGEGSLSLTYISVPLLLKISPFWRLGIFVGPQFDYLAAATSNPNTGSSTDQMKNFVDYDYAGTVGLEFWITRNIGVFGRYIKGYNNINDIEQGNATVPTQPLNPSITVDEIKNEAWQFGLTISLRTKEKKSAPAPAPIVDLDQDGINDENDKCPNQFGTAKYMGCPIPDTDGDTINDENDKCPTQAGLARYNGCPIPDTDSDSINDENDKCPSQWGLARYNGCPIPDTDTDGVNDEIDKCPNVTGIADNLGCPEIIVYYQRDQATLTAYDKGNLDRVIKFLNNNPTLNISIQSHTSTTGKADYNQKLSEKRATATMNYLIYKGINKERLSVIGFGEQFPVGDNETEEGRAQSRRTVIKIQK